MDSKILRHVGVLTVRHLPFVAQANTSNPPAVHGKVAPLCNGGPQAAHRLVGHILRTSLLSLLNLFLHWTKTAKSWSFNVYEAASLPCMWRRIMKACPIPELTATNCSFNKICVLKHHDVQLAELDPIVDLGSELTQDIFDYLLPELACRAFREQIKRHRKPSTCC